MKVMELRRLRTGDGEPIGLQTASLSLSRFPGLDGEGLEDVSLYYVLRSAYGVTLVEAIETFRIGEVGTADARLLGVAPRSPAFMVERRTFDRLGPFEHVVSLMRPDRYEVRLRLTRA
jgi:GntR family transcriptional regulator